VDKSADVCSDEFVVGISDEFADVISDECIDPASEKVRLGSHDFKFIRNSSANSQLNFLMPGAARHQKHDVQN